MTRPLQRDDRDSKIVYQGRTGKLLGQWQGWAWIILDDDDLPITVATFAVSVTW